MHRFPHLDHFVGNCVRLILLIFRKLIPRNFCNVLGSTVSHVARSLPKPCLPIAIEVRKIVFGCKEPVIRNKDHRLIKPLRTREKLTALFNQPTLVHEACLVVHAPLEIFPIFIS